jgi:arsenate reductase
MAAKPRRSRDELVLYVKSTCTTCRQALELVAERGLTCRVIDIFKTPLDSAALGALFAQLGVSPREVLRTKDPAYVALGLADPKCTDAQVLAAMVAHPGLIQRPIAVRGRHALVARPAARLTELLD